MGAGYSTVRVLPPRSFLWCRDRVAGPWPEIRELLPQLMLGLVVSSCIVFEEPEDPSNRSFFSEIISSISDVKFSHSGRYIMTRDYLTVKVWDLNMENRPIETYQVSVAQPGACSSGAPTEFLLEPHSGPVAGAAGTHLMCGSFMPVDGGKQTELLNVGSSGLVSCHHGPRLGVGEERKLRCRQPGEPGGRPCAEQ